MPDLLTEEELLALEEQLLAQEQQTVMLPQDEPPAPMIDFQSPVAMPFIRPPGPSEEFLRRSQTMGGAPLPAAPPRWGRGVVESFNPETGLREEFSAISPPRSASADYMEQLRNQINATQFKSQADALNAAMQFQHMREFQRLTEEGVPTERALLQTGPGMFSKNPNVLAPLINATRPAPRATMRDLGGGVRVIEDGRSTKLVPREPQEPKPRPIQPRVVVGADEFGEPKVTWSGSPEDFAKQFPGATLKGPASEPATPAKTAGEEPVVKTQKEFDALPKGSIYIGKDGKRYRKP